MKLLLALLLLFCSPSWAAFTDIKFGRYQVADSQWNVSACTQTTTCQIYSKNPGTAYKIPWTSGQLSWAAGDYIKFESSGNASYPWLAKQYDSLGNVKATLGTGKIINMGPDYFFFVGNDNNTGQLFSGSSGMSGTAGVSWTGTLNPTAQQVDNYANASYSTVPLAAGQTATQTPNSSTTTTTVVATNPRPTWPVINRAANQIQFGTGRTGGWWFNWWDCCGSLTNYPISNRSVWNVGTGSGYNDYMYSWMRWPGADNGVSKTIWFRTGYDDNHRLYINGQLVTNGVCCSFAYGYYTAKPGEIVKLEFYSDNTGGPYSAEVAWDPDGDGVYELLGSPNTALNNPAGGSSYWYTSDITADQTNILNAARTRQTSIALGNRIDLETKTGTSNPVVNIEQSGNYNLIQGLGGGNAIIDGDNNTLTVKQGSVSGRNLIELGIYGDNNNTTLWQSRDMSTGIAAAPESGGHYSGVGINGNSNTVTVKQRNDGGVSSGHFSLLYITGNTNTVTISQANNTEKRLFATISGSNDTLNVSQTGTGNHYVDVLLTGNNHTANVTQTGTGTHRATINLQNVLGASILNLTQQGSTGQQYSISQQCANLNGCSVTVIQGTGP